MWTPPPPEAVDMAWSTDSADGPMSHFPLCQQLIQTLYNYQPCSLRSGTRQMKRVVERHRAPGYKIYIYIYVKFNESYKKHIYFRH